MDIFENFFAFDEGGGDPVKLMAKNHQFIGVNRVFRKCKQYRRLRREIRGVLAYPRFW